MDQQAQSTQAAIALDGGTTNTRARWLQGDRVVATARRAVGVRDAVTGARAGTLAEAVRACLDEVREAACGSAPELIVAAGMLSSEVGLAAVPHVVAPAGLDELARAVVVRRIDGLGDQPIHLVPGVRTPPGPGPDGWADADVMRGEECETLGAWEALSNSIGGGRAGRLAAVFVWPGSHTKVVGVDGEGRILSSFTTLAGELMAALAGHTLLAASLPAAWPAALDPDALAAGARLAARDGLGRAAFLVRIADLTRRFEPPARAAFWLGAVVADDAAQIARHALLRAGVPVWVGGRQPQRRLYAAELSGRVTGPVSALEDSLAEAVSARGALAIARRSGRLGQGA